MATRPFIVDITGPSGAGKSTVTLRLYARLREELGVQVVGMHLSDHPIHPLRPRWQRIGWLLVHPNTVLLAKRGGGPRWRRWLADLVVQGSAQGARVGLVVNDSSLFQVMGDDLPQPAPPRSLLPDLVLCLEATSGDLRARRQRRGLERDERYLARESRGGRDRHAAARSTPHPLARHLGIPWHQVPTGHGRPLADVVEECLAVIRRSLPAADRPPTGAASGGAAGALGQ